MANLFGTISGIEHLKQNQFQSLWKPRQRKEWMNPAPNQSEDCLMKFLLQALFPLSEYDSIIIRYFYKYSLKSIVILSLGELLYSDN